MPALPLEMGTAQEGRIPEALPRLLLDQLEQAAGETLAQEIIHADRNHQHKTIMPTYQKCSVTNDGDAVLKIAKLLIAAFEPLRPLEKVKVDFVWAFADLNDKGEQCNDAITLRGHRAYGLCRIVNLKDRAKGNGDAEIVIDHDYWQTIPEAQQRALLDHELNHIQICVNKKGDPKFDDLNRPKLTLRKHDIEVGWFSSVAQRHGKHSLEQIQAKQILDSDGQYLWPQLIQDGTQVSSPKRLTGEAKP